MKKSILAVALSALVFTACGTSNSEKAALAEDSVKMEVVLAQGTLTVQGACEMCKENIETAAKGVAGVSAAEWNIDTKSLILSLDNSKTDVATVSKAIAAVGYDTEKDKADDAVYASLPSCCQYR